MKEAFLLERRLWGVWSRRHNLSLSSSYEKRAWRKLFVKGLTVSESAIKNDIRRSKIVIFGDDSFVPQDQVSLGWVLKECVGSSRKCYVITDRYPTARTKMPVKSFNPCKESSHLLGQGIQDVYAWAHHKNIDIVTCRHRRSMEGHDQSLVHAVKTLLKKGDKIIVWTGALRLAEGRLYKELGALNSARCGLIVQAAPARWRNEQHKGWMQGSPGLYYFAGRSPLLSLEMVRLHQTGDQHVLCVESLSRIFEQCLGFISGQMGDRKKIRPRMILHPFDIKLFEKLSSNDLPFPVKRFLWQRLCRSECAVIPSEGLAVISTLHPRDVAEEAGHWLRLSGQSQQRFGFFMTAVEEAFGFLVSSWFSQGSGEKLPASASLSPWARVHVVGYRMGAKLAMSWKRSKKDREIISRLWKIRPKNEIQAYLLFRALEGSV